MTIPSNSPLLDSMEPEVVDRLSSRREAIRAGGRAGIGLWSAIAIVIGTTIGSGIFRSPAGIADRLPGPLPLAAIWVAGGLFALCGAGLLLAYEMGIPFFQNTVVGTLLYSALLFGSFELLRQRVPALRPQTA